ncbi:hypothetical protein BN1723_020387, partial [Verticillium longisporum]
LRPQGPRAARVRTAAWADPGPGHAEHE